MKRSVNRTPVIGKSFVFRESQVFLSPICFLSRFHLKYFLLLFYLREIFLYVSFQILRGKSVKIDQLALVRRLVTVFPRELGVALVMNTSIRSYSLSGKDLVRCSLCPSGNIHGNGQPHGTLMEPYVYLQTPLWEGIPLTIEVASPVGPTRYEGSAPLIT